LFPIDSFNYPCSYFGTWFIFCVNIKSLSLAHALSTSPNLDFARLITFVHPAPTPLKSHSKKIVVKYVTPLKKNQIHSLNNCTINTHVNSWTKQVIVPFNWEKTYCINSHSFITTPLVLNLQPPQTSNEKNIIDLCRTINNGMEFYKAIAYISDYR
jgi:hypothetical protein